MLKKGRLGELIQGPRLEAKGGWQIEREREREREVKDSEKLQVRREIRVKVKTKHMTTKVRGLGC